MIAQGKISEMLNQLRGSSLKSGAKKEPQSQKIARTVPKNFLNNSKALQSKTRALRQIAPESSPESSAKSLLHKFFGVHFLSLMKDFTEGGAKQNLIRSSFSGALFAPPPPPRPFFLQSFCNYEVRLQETILMTPSLACCS